MLRNSDILEITGFILKIGFLWMIVSFFGLEYLSYRYKWELTWQQQAFIYISANLVFLVVVGLCGYGIYRLIPKRKYRERYPDVI